MYSVGEYLRALTASEDVLSEFAVRHIQRDQLGDYWLSCSYILDLDDRSIVQITCGQANDLGVAIPNEAAPREGKVEGVAPADPRGRVHLNVDRWGH